MSELHAACRDNAVVNALLARELGQVLSALREAGVPVIPLKGVALAESLYGDRALRVCSDLDILVPRRFVGQARDAILAMGYRTEFTERFFADLLLRHDIECAFTRLVGGMDHSLDLHWGISWPGARERHAMGLLWTVARPARFDGREVYGLPPEWQLLVLAVHAARHRWRGLKWLVDIHELCARDGLDWMIVNRTAAEIGWLDIVSITLGLSRALFETPVPTELAEAVPSWLDGAPLDRDSSTAWRSAVFPMRLLPNRSDKLRHLARVALVPTLAERRAVRLPSVLTPLYYAIRPLRLAGRAAWHAASSRAERVAASSLR